MAPDRGWTFVRALYAVAGACVFLVLNALMWASEHPFWGGAQAAYPGEWTPYLLVIAFVLLLVAAVGWRGQSFSVGFVAALAVLTVASMGSCTSHWADPFHYLRVYRRDVESTTRNRASATAADQKWRDSLRIAGISRASGARRPLLIMSCIETYRHRDSTRRLPPDSVAITNQGSGCRDWDVYLVGRHSGWNWRYLPSNTGGGAFVVESYPDPAIGLHGPLFRIDESGLLVERQRSGAPAMLVTSPVAVMHALRACIRQALALPHPRGSARARPLTLEAIRNLPASTCPSFGDVTYGGIGAGDSNAAVIRLPQDALPRDQVTGYTLFYVPQGRTGGAFDVLARPQYFAGSGVRSYLLTDAGQLHVTAEQRAATPADPVPEPCEVDLTAPCRTSL